VWSLPGIGYADNSLPLYLSVDVWPTNYALSSDQWATVTVNGVSVMDFCTPSDSCGEDWHNCLESVDISDLISEQYGGHIVVEVSSTGVNTGPCDKEGFPLYARMLLQEALPLQTRLSVWAIIGSVFGAVCLVLMLFWFLYVRYFRQRYATIYGPDDVSARLQRDVESCGENELGFREGVFVTEPEPEPEAEAACPGEGGGSGPPGDRKLAQVFPLETDLEIQEIETDPEAEAEAVMVVPSLIEEDEEEEEGEGAVVMPAEIKKKKTAFSNYNMELDPEDQKLIDDVDNVRKRLAESSSSSRSNSASSVQLNRRPLPEGPRPEAYKEEDEEDEEGGTTPQQLEQEQEFPIEN
jgi:hypothetical protein